MGFDPRIETINANEAWLGSIPIHGWYDVRKPLVSTRNLVDIMPLTSIWSGLAVNPCPYYPAEHAGALLRRDHRQHAVPLQPPRGRYRPHASRSDRPASGKSVALGVIVANARAIPGMQIFFMDKGYSAFVLTKALGGQHLDLGEEEVPLQPLARIDDPTDRMKIQVST